MTKDRLTIAIACLAVTACGAFFAPASRGPQTLLPGAEYCFHASGVRVYAVGRCPNEPRLADAVDAAALLPTDKAELRVVVVDRPLLCNGRRALSCSDGWTVTVRTAAPASRLTYELRNILAARAIGHTPAPAPPDDYEHLPGWDE